jgi:probable phosphoglycerate mutase
MRTRLVIVRHGESEWNAEERLQGQSDPKLSERGREQAARLEPVLAEMTFDGVIASDLVRARDTAALAGFPDAPTDPRWREIGLGEWETLLNAEVALEELEAWRAGRLVPPGAETWSEFEARVAEAVEELAGRGGTWLVFSHGGCVRAASAHVTGAPIESFAGPANTSITMLELDPRRRLLAFNRADDDGVPRPSDPGGTAGGDQG